MHTNVIRVFLAVALMTGTPDLRGATAQELLNEDWLLDPSLSNVYMQTVKANAIFETYKFNTVEGTIAKNGDASIRIELASIETGIDLRDVRMRFLLFEVFKFPNAEISAKLDKSKLRALATGNRVSYPLKLTLSMHGIVKEMETAVWVTSISDTTVSVATIQPIIVTAETFGFTGGIAKLSESVGGTLIAPAASITFDLMFGSGSRKPALESARATRAVQRAEQAGSAILPEACETRLSVISQMRAIYFKTASANLDRESEPLLDSGADIAIRCASVKIDVEGHTDNVGAKSLNQKLSELRAKAVVAYLIRKGVNAARIRSAGYGDTRPVAANDTEANRAKNRRIEFKVKKN